MTKRKVSFRKSTWQPTEDNILRELVNKHGKKHWQKIANELNEKIGNGPHRAGKQCRERWLNHLDDSIRKDPWSTQEDLTLLTKQKIIGNKWSEIVKYLPGRTENMVKNRFNTLAKQKREEKRNNEVKKLDEVIVSLEEAKEGKDPKESWIDEKIAELQEILGKEISNKMYDNHMTPMSMKMSGMSLQEKRQLKYHHKNGYYAEGREKFDRPSHNYSQDAMHVKYMGSVNENLSHMKEMTTNSLSKGMNYEVKENNGMMYDSTPKQYFDTRDISSKHIGVFASPMEPRRILGSHHTRSNTMQISDYGALKNQNFMTASPMLTPSMKPAGSIDRTPINQNMLSPNMNLTNYIKNNLNSPSCLSARSSVLKVLKAKNKGDKEQLEAIKNLLVEFRNYEDHQKDKIIKSIDNMISKNDSGFVPSTPQVSKIHLIDETIVICS